MNPEAAQPTVDLPRTEKPASNASRLVRRVHMYLGLFLAPWMCMYALSTLVMTHREFALSFYPTKTPTLVTERELDYARTFASDATPQQMGRQILGDLGLDGTHRVSGGKDGKPLVIVRQHAWVTRRVTFNPKTKKLSIQREEFRALTFLERLHRRRGYEHPYTLEDTWAVSVDLAVAAMVFWSLSGIWLWWELGPTRGWGTVSMALGLVLFGVFLVLL
jgi:hypothetical protein